MANSVGELFFKSFRYLRACKYIGIPPYKNPNYKAELKACGLWGKSASKED